MKNIFFLCLLSLSTACLYAQNQHLKLVADIYPPFTDRPGEKTVALDIVKEGLSRSGVEAETNIGTFDEILKALIHGTSDGSAAFWKSEERMDAFYFSDPYLVNQLILVGRSREDVTHKSIDDLYHKRVGILTNYDFDINEARAAGVELIFNESDQSNLEQLISGRLDYILVDALLIKYIMKYQVNEVNEMLAIAETPFISRPLHLALRKEVPNAEKIIEDFNRALKAMLRDGVVNEILGLSAMRADIDGDGQSEVVLYGGPAGEEKPQSIYTQTLERQYMSDEERIEGRASERIYYDGVFYDNWDALPSAIRQEARPEVTDDPYQAGVKFRLER